MAETDGQGAADDMRKVFILGAHRSGTSKLASYFQDVLGFQGHAEGHIYRLLTYLQTGRRIIVQTIPENAYEVNRIGFDAVFGCVTQALDGLISAHHGYRDYYDKTPGREMIEAAPILHAHLPQARFIHLHRNGIENVRSNLRLWPDRDFSDACRMWASSIKAYFEVRERLGDRLLDIRHQDLLQDPWGCHGRILAHLGLPQGAKEAEITAYFSRESTTSTQDVSKIQLTPTLAGTGWTDAQQETFVTLCGEAMQKCGYDLL